MHLNLSVTSAAVCSKVLDFLLLILGLSLLPLFFGFFLFAMQDLVFISSFVVVDFCLLLLPLRESVIVLYFVIRFSFAIILMGKRELVALLNLSSWCLVMFEWLFLAVPQGCLQFVIVVFPDHTQLLFLQ